MPFDQTAHSGYIAPMEDEPKPARMITPLPESLLARIDEWRYENRIGSRAEAVRRLLTEALDRYETKPRKPSGRR